MNSDNTKKEKILALLTVVLLFLLVGSLFYYISLKNKEKTDILRSEVQRLRAENKIKQQLDAITLKEATSTDALITAKSFLSLAVTNNGLKKILNQKEPDLPLPVASITKLLLAVVILENVDLDTEVTVSSNYIGLEESVFVLELGRTYKVKDLLANALIPSDNDSARLLAGIIGESNFIDKMNQKAKELGMNNTHYVNPTGLDPQDINADLNKSSVADLANLLLYIKETHPEILKITGRAEYNFCDINGFCRVVKNTNKLLDDKDFKFRIIGGKTGSTDLALKNLVLIARPTDNLTLINIVLGSVDNFMDMSSLINKIEIN